MDGQVLIFYPLTKDYYAFNSSQNQMVMTTKIRIVIILSTASTSDIWPSSTHCAIVQIVTPSWQGNLPSRSQQCQLPQSICSPSGDSVLPRGSGTLLKLRCLFRHDLAFVAIILLTFSDARNMGCCFKVKIKSYEPPLTRRRDGVSMRSSHVHPCWIAGKLFI